MDQNIRVIIIVTSLGGVIVGESSPPVRLSPVSPRGGGGCLMLIVRPCKPRKMNIQ